MTPKLQSALTHALMLAAGAVASAYGLDLAPICPECPVCEGEVPEASPSPAPEAPPEEPPLAPLPTE